jgi:hypothetical protein
MPDAGCGNEKMTIIPILHAIPRYTNTPSQIKRVSLHHIISCTRRLAFNFKVLRLSLYRLKVLSDKVQVQVLSDKVQPVYPAAVMTVRRYV